MKKITVLGWYGKSNIGDESYKIAFPKVFNNCEFTFTDRITDHHQADEYVLGGGDILANNLIENILKTNKPCSIISASGNNQVDPEKLKKFKSIILRDDNSVKIIEKKGLNPTYAPDLAFSLTADKQRGAELIKNLFQEEKRDQYQNVIAVILNGYLIDNHQSDFDLRRFLAFQKMSFQLANVMDSTNASFLFIPFGQNMPWDDRITNMWTFQKTKFWKKNLCIYKEPNVQNVLDIIAACDMAISSRLHSTIFSIVAGTPFLDITHNHKNKWLLETLNLKQFSISYKSFDEERASEIIKDVMSRKEEYSNNLREISERQKSLLGGINGLFDS